MKIGYYREKKGKIKGKNSFPWIEPQIERFYVNEILNQIVEKKREI